MVVVMVAATAMVMGVTRNHDSETIGTEDET